MTSKNLGISRAFSAKTVCKKSARDRLYDNLPQFVDYLPLGIVGSLLFERCDLLVR
jgi:hypothetical protein